MGNDVGMLPHPHTHSQEQRTSVRTHRRTYGAALPAVKGPLTGPRPWPTKPRAPRPILKGGCTVVWPSWGSWGPRLPASAKTPTGTPQCPYPTHPEKPEMVPLWTWVRYSLHSQTPLGPGGMESPHQGLTIAPLQKFCIFSQFSPPAAPMDPPGHHRNCNVAVHTWSFSFKIGPTHSPQCPLPRTGGTRQYMQYW